MSQSRRYWPPGLEEGVFIKRPHAVEQLMERAKYPRGYSPDLAEEELRNAVVDEIRAGKTLTSYKNHSTANDFVVRVELEGREVVYPLIERGDKAGRFQFLIHTVFSRDMYQQWSRDGKLGSLGDLPQAGVLKSIRPIYTPPPEAPMPQSNGTTSLIILYRGDGGTLREKETTEKEVTDAILELLMSGASLKDMRVLKEIEFDLKFQLKK